MKNIPKSNAFPEIEKSDFGLKSLDCEIWHGMIFIRFGGDGPSIAEFPGYGSVILEPMDSSILNLNLTVVS